jgi:hypothetical protein
MERVEMKLPLFLFKIREGDSMTQKPSRAVCVLGMHRSGTSAIARSVNLLGAHIGEEHRMMPPAEENPEGFWEHAEIVEIHDRILAFFESSWDTTVPLPDGWWKEAAIQPYKERLKEIVYNEFAFSPLWTWKDPRTSILLPLWKELLGEMGIELIYLIAIRNPLDVVASLTKRNGFGREKSLGIWTLYTISALYETEGQQRSIMQYDDFLADWEGSLRQVAADLDIPWPEDEEGLRRAMGTFLKPSLRHSQSRLEELAEDEAIPETVVDVYRYGLDPSGSGKDIRRLYQGYVTQVKMIAAHSPRALREMHLQVFWGMNFGFTEENSVRVPVDLNNRMTWYELTLPANAWNSLRIDPVDRPALVEIARLEFVDPDTGETLLKGEANNGWLGLEILNHGVRVESSDAYVLLAVGEDPILFLPQFQGTVGKAIRLRIQMRVHSSIREEITLRIGQELRKRR